MTTDVPEATFQCDYVHLMRQAFMRFFVLKFISNAIVHCRTLQPEIYAN